MDFQLTRKPCPSWLCQGWPGFSSNCSLELKVRSIRLVGIVLSMFCLIERVPYLRFDYHLGDLDILLSHLRGLETQYTRLGFGGYWGSKGCVSIRYFNQYLILRN